LQSTNTICNRLTGGEPTVNKKLPELIKYIRSIPTVKSIGITTNGIVVKSQLTKLVEAGLTHINISLDTLIPEKFESISRRDKKWLARVLAAVYAAIDVGLVVKINCVLIRGVNDDEIKDFVELSRESPVNVRFIELMPFDDNKWDDKKLITYFEVIDVLKQQGIGLVKEAKKDPHDTTKWYEPHYLSDTPSADTATGESTEGVGVGEEERERCEGRLGFITSMSSNFCGGCNRLRLTADGKIKVCLFGSDELNLLQALREGKTNEEVIAMISDAINKKEKALGGHKTLTDLAGSKNRPMILIGG
jgi:cyclic pyranopterin phosphate synthase